MREHADFADEFERKRLFGLAGSTQDRVDLFSNWDAALPQRKLHAAPNPHSFERWPRPLDLVYEHGGEDRSRIGRPT